MQDREHILLKCKRYRRWWGLRGEEQFIQHLWTYKDFVGFLSENTESAFTSGDAREQRAETRASRYNVNNGRVNSPYGMSAPRPEATRIVNVEPPHVSSTARFKQSNWKQEKTAFGVGDLGACRRYDLGKRPPMSASGAFARAQWPLMFSALRPGGVIRLVLSNRSSFESTI